MSELIKILDVQALEGRWLRLTFSDGTVKDVDLHALLGAGGAFAAIRDDRAAFEQVRVNPETQTIEWPGLIDLDPDVLYGRHEAASGIHIARRIVRERSAAPA